MPCRDSSFSAVPRRQRGAALLVVLGMLVGSSILGISAMNLSLTGERLAGNQKASVQARMVAESAAAGLSDYLRLEDQAAREASAWADTPLATALAGGALPECASEAQRLALWADSETYTLYGNAYPQARVVICDAQDGSEASAAILGLAGSPQSPARYPATMTLVKNAEGLATTNFIGGIAEDADIQWPTSQNSRLDMGPGGKAIYFDELVGDSHAALFEALIESGDLEQGDYTALDKAALIESMGENTDKIIDGSPQNAIAAARPDRDGVDATIGLLQDIYQACQGEGGEADTSPPANENSRANNGKKDKKDNKDKNDNNGSGSGSAGGGLCTYVRIVPPGASKNDSRLQGNETFHGLYIDLSGKLDIRGNSRVRGAAVVANVEVIDGNWVSLPNQTLKLAGGGNAGTVWYDELNLEAAIAELKNLDPERFDELSIETFWGGGSSTSSGWSLDGWMEMSVSGG